MSCHWKSSVLVLVTSMLLILHSSRGADVSEAEPGTTVEGERRYLPRGHKENFGHHLETLLEVDTVTDIDPETFYRDYYKPGRPLVVKGGASHWPAVRRWGETSYLREKFGHSKLTVNLPTGYENLHWMATRMGMSEYLDLYDHQKSFMDSSATPEMLRDLLWPRFLHCPEFISQLKQIAVFFNSGKSSTDLHIDTVETFFHQVTGRRRWILAPPTASTDFYADGFRYHSGISPINQNAVDLIKFPTVARVKEIYNVSTEAGDIIYVPEGWFHQVRAFEKPNLAVALFIHFTWCFENRHQYGDEENNTRYLKVCYDTRKLNASEISCKPPKSEQVMWEIAKNLPEYREPSSEDQVMVMHTLKSGAKFPALGLKLPGNASEDVITRALSEGYRLFYITPGSKSSEMLGRHLSKGTHATRKETVLVARLQPDEIIGRKVLNLALKTLGTDYLDLLILDNPVYQCLEGCDVKALGLTESFQTIKELYREKVFLDFAVSHFGVGALESLLRLKELPPVSVVEHNFNPLQQNKKLRRFCKENNLEFMAENVLGGAWPAERGQHPLLDAQEMMIMGIVMHSSPAAVLLRWAIDKGVMVVPRSADARHVFLNWQLFFMEQEKMDILGSLDLYDREPPLLAPLPSLETIMADTEG